MLPTDQGQPPLPERVGVWLTSWVDRLPQWLRRVVTRELVGFAILGAFTFGVDLVLLWFLRTHTALPTLLTVSGAYAAAFALNFVLNRTVNFRSHAPVGRQALRYALVVLCDFGLTVGGTATLIDSGWDFRLARLTAATSVAVFTYSAARWWVFRDRPQEQEPTVSP